MNPFNVRGLVVAPGEIQHFRIPAVTLPSGAPVDIPVTIAHGVQPGPVLLLTGATHGVEVAGTRALLKLVAGLNANAMSGTVISVPVTNPLAFDQAQYATSQDGIHMAMPVYWPTMPEGSATRRLGAALRPLFDVATHYIDLHNNMEPAIPMCFRFEDQCSSEDVRAVQRQMSEAFGFTSVRMTEPDDDTANIVGGMDGQPAAAASAHGKPGLMVELVNTRGIYGDDLGVVGVRNVMSALGMLGDPIRSQECPRLEGDFRFCGLLTTGGSGLISPVRPPGELVEAGDEVVQVLDMTGSVVDSVRMPVTGIAWAYLGSPLDGHGTMAVTAGHPLAFIAKREQRS